MAGLNVLNGQLDRFRHCAEKKRIKKQPARIIGQKIYSGVLI